MPTLTAYRFTLQPYAGPKSLTTCPACGTPGEWKRYLDTDTNQLLPDEYGRCNRELKCGYALSPYTPPAGGGLSYATATERGEATTGYTAPARPARPALAPALPVASIPADVYAATLGHDERNILARLLRQHFGHGVANELLTRFHIGTSARWPGATVFWHLDERGRTRAGKIMLFADDWHRVKTPTPHIDSVPSALEKVCQRRGQPVPAWLIDYKAHGQGCLFGLSQLATAPTGQPVAICEAEKTCILATPYFPQFVWLATGGLSKLTSERMEPLRGRRIILYPDAGAFDKWQLKANELQRLGYDVRVSDELEKRATPDEKAAGFDLADVLLREWPGYPPSWDQQ